MSQSFMVEFNQIAAMFMARHLMVRPQKLISKN